MRKRSPVDERIRRLCQDFFAQRIAFFLIALGVIAAGLTAGLLMNGPNPLFPWLLLIALLLPARASFPTLLLMFRACRDRHAGRTQRMEITVKQIDLSRHRLQRARENPKYLLIGQNGEKLLFSMKSVEDQTALIHLSGRRFEAEYLPESRLLISLRPLIGPKEFRRETEKDYYLSLIQPVTSRYPFPE